MVRADGAHQLQVPRAAHAGHLGPEGFGDLDRKRADSAGRTVDQNFLPRLNLPLVAEPLQGDEGVLGYGRRLLIGYVDRF